MKLVRMERAVHYGNTGIAFSEERPADDPYLFPPENTRDLWSHARTFTERYGYAFYMDERGYAVLATKNNPTVITDLDPDMPEVSTATRALHPSAYSGTYCRWTASPAQFTVRVKAARIDLSLPVGCDPVDYYADPDVPVITALGAWSFTVRRVSDNAVMATGTITPTPGDVPVLFYDYRADLDNVNATVATLFSGYYGEYDVVLQGTGGGTRWAVDAFLLWAVDPSLPLGPNALSTSTNALKVVAKSGADDQRNYVIVVGRRNATVTDSEKLQTTESNPAAEFTVAAAVDVASITDPTSPNYTGTERAALIYDNSITDRDFAEYIARTFIYRYRMPKSSSTVEHTLIPALQLRDPVYVVEDTFETIGTSTVQYVKSIKHRLTGEEATTELETIAYPEYPSYEPRQDIDIDRFYAGRPVTNVSVSYTAVAGNRVTNALEAALRPGRMGADSVHQVVVPVGASANIPAPNPWPPVPGTLYLTAGTSTAPTQTATQTFTSKLPRGGATDFLQLTDPTPTPIQSVTVTVKVPSSQFGAAGVSVDSAPYTVKTSLSQTTPSDPFYWQYVGDLQTLRVYCRTDSTIIPGGFYLPSSVTYSATVRVAYTQYLTATGSYTNIAGTTPYHHFVEPFWTGRSVRFPWRQGFVGQENLYGPGAVSTPSYTLSYRAFPSDGSGDPVDPYAGACPFYDPYTSEIGYLVRVRFDALISGLYRITVRSVEDDTVVAYLTNATGDASNPEQHWEFITAGAGRERFWDGIDQVGEWNRRQSAYYGEAAKGAFPGYTTPVVGAGNYVWNKEDSPERRAFIHFSTDADGKPEFGYETYSAWYVLIEAKNDWTEEVAELARTTTTDVPSNSPMWLRRNPIRVYSTLGKSIGFTNNLWNPDPQALIFTVLPPPTRVEIDHADWRSLTAGSARNIAYSPALPQATIDDPDHWVTRGASNPEWATQNPDAIINNEHPVRVRFKMSKRPGPLWAGLEEKASVKLHRVVHLRRNMADQFVIFAGQNYPGKPTENRRVVSRTSTNDDHTIVFSDDNYRGGDSFKTAVRDGVEWIFRPDNFRKDFRGVKDEALQYLDYLQLDEVPSWNGSTTIAGPRARFQIAFIGDLFYLSVYTQDRSGRFQWCIDRTFVDKAKIPANTAGDWTGQPTQWPDDPNTQFRRFVITRQWAEEGGVTGGVSAYAQQLITTYNIGSALATKLAEHYWHNWGPTTARTSFGGSGWDRDEWTYYHTNQNDDKAGGGMPATYNNVPQLSTSSGAATVLGDWTWETGPLWVPAPTRDFHGYHLVPPMAAPAYLAFDGLGTDQFYKNARCYMITDGGDSDLDRDANTGADCAKYPVWNSPIRDMTQTSYRRFWPMRVVQTDDDWKKDVFDVDAKTLDYQRQAGWVHWEDLRGIWSRGPRAAEAPRKVQSAGPYYHNPYRYGSMSVRYVYKFDGATRVPLPLVYTDVNNWFEFTFRSEYLWESSQYFPCNKYGGELLQWYNWRRAQMPWQTGRTRPYYDDGAWTGWKDHLDASGSDGFGTVVQGATFNGPKAPSTPVSVFSWPNTNPGTVRWPAVGLMGKLPTTTPMRMHVVLLNERREVGV